MRDASGALQIEMAGHETASNLNPLEEINNSDKGKLHTWIKVSIGFLDCDISSCLLCNLKGKFIKWAHKMIIVSQH